MTAIWYYDMITKYISDLQPDGLKTGRKFNRLWLRVRTKN